VATKRLPENAPLTMRESRKRQNEPLMTPEQVAEGGAGDREQEDRSAAAFARRWRPERGEDELKNREERAEHAAEEDGGEGVVTA